MRKRRGKGCRKWRGWASAVDITVEHLFHQVRKRLAFPWMADFQGFGHMSKDLSRRNIEPDRDESDKKRAAQEVIGVSRGLGPLTYEELRTELTPSFTHA
jgi:hypothetical protein